MNPDPLVAAKNVYKFLDENARVRVLEVVFQPGDVAKMHHHPDHTVYALKGGKLKVTTSDGKSNTMNVEPGKVIFMDEQDHEAQNVGDSVIDLLVVELK